MKRLLQWIKDAVDWDDERYRKHQLHRAGFSDTPVYDYWDVSGGPIIDGTCEEVFSMPSAANN